MFIYFKLIYIHKSCFHKFSTNFIQIKKKNIDETGKKETKIAKATKTLNL